MLQLLNTVPVSAIGFGAQWLHHQSFFVGQKNKMLKTRRKTSEVGDN